MSKTTTQICSCGQPWCTPTGYACGECWGLLPGRIQKQVLARLQVADVLQDPSALESFHTVLAALRAIAEPMPLHPGWKAETPIQYSLDLSAGVALRVLEVEKAGPPQWCAYVNSVRYPERFNTKEAAMVHAQCQALVTMSAAIGNLAVMRK